MPADGSRTVRPLRGLISPRDGPLARRGPRLESRHDRAAAVRLRAAAAGRGSRRVRVVPQRPRSSAATELAQHDLVREPLPDDVFERYSGFLVGGSPFNVTDPESTKTDVQRRLEADLERIAAASRPATGTAARRRCSPATASASSRACSAARSAARTPRTPARSRRADAGRPVRPALRRPRDAVHGAHRAQGGSRRTRRPARRCSRRTTRARCRPTASATASTRRSSTPSRRPARSPSAWRCTATTATSPRTTTTPIAGRVLAASVTEPARLLRAFARAFGPARLSLRLRPGRRVAQQLDALVEVGVERHVCPRRRSSARSACRPAARAGRMPRPGRPRRGRASASRCGRPRPRRSRRAGRRRRARPVLAAIPR